MFIYYQFYEYILVYVITAKLIVSITAPERYQKKTY
jgi:hypothetical protein